MRVWLERKTFYRPFIEISASKFLNISGALIRLAIARGELPEGYNSKESGYQLTPLVTPKTPKKRKKIKRKVIMPIKALEPKKRTPSPPPPPPPPLFELERTFEHTIIPSPQEMSNESDSPDKETFIKKFKCILNKVTPENMKVIIFFQLIVFYLFYIRGDLHITSYYTRSSMLNALLFF